MISLGTTNELITQPLQFALLHSQIDHPFRIVQQTPERNCRDLLENKLDAAVISAVDYARNSSELQLVKDFAVYSSGATRYALLFFRENLRRIDQIAYFTANSQYHLLAGLVLNEFFEMPIEWQKLDKIQPPEDVLNFYPACFLEKDAALDNFLKFESKLDILEEWYDKTEISYVHQLLALRREEENKDFIEPLLRSREIGMRNLMQIAKDHAAANENSWDFYFDLINEIFQYFPTEDTWSALQQYFEYLFYYGMVDYIPELHF